MKYGKKFFKHLKTELNNYFQDYGEDARQVYMDSKSWTKVISKNPVNERSLIDKVLYFIFNDCKSSNEYYRIDNSVYIDIKGGYFKDYNGSCYKLHKWKLMGAVEHENNYQDWTDELVKLAYITCPLRVVISYGDYQNEYKEAIKIANIIAKQIKLKDYVNNNQEYILIFGPRVKDIKENPNVNIAEMYKGYIFNGKEFVNLK